MSQQIHTNRRDFVSALAKAAVLLIATPGTLVGRVSQGFAGHPDPRENVTGSNVLLSETVHAHVQELFAQVREIPEVVDGIGCHCGCGVMPGMRSLLSCYEGIGMAQFCMICEGEGRMAVELNKEGKSLDEIRAAIDRRYG